MPIYRKLSLLTIALVVVMTCGLLSLVFWGGSRYQEELVQRLNSDIANYIIEHQKEPLILNSGQANVDSLKALAMHAMMINPLIEIYLLNANGDILGHALHTDDVILNAVNLEPVQRALLGDYRGMIRGDDPRNANHQRVFSTAPIIRDEQIQGYLYVVLASQQWEVLAENLNSSYFLRLVMFGIAATFVILLLVGLFGFYQITQPIRRLQHTVGQFHLEKAGPLATQDASDELTQLQHSFAAMRERIDTQFSEIQRSDRLRRELITNVSHDLRTPVAAIQGYIETLILKQDTASFEERHQYLQTALKHCRRLTQLIASLFELAKLDALSDEPRKETFSLSELVYDIVQEYQLKAGEKGIRIDVVQEQDNIYVNADISLMARVFQNLIDNALRYTPRQGQISIDLATLGNEVQIRINDSGEGIASEDVPYVFERYFQSRSGQESASSKSGSGLGLAIVKRILELHGSVISVASVQQQGTSFSFSLSAA